MLITSYLQQLKKQYQTQTTGRRKLAELSSQAQHLAKQAIFAAQRDNLPEADKLLAEANSLLTQGQLLTRKVKELESLGSYRAALEEYVEAELFTKFLQTGKLDKVGKFNITPEVYLGGLSDMVGELVRYAIKLATAGKIKEVDKLVEVGTMVVGELAAMNLTGILRTKFDQAKQHLRRLEDIRYDLSIRRHV
jgi:predicted translin family RNA/ssDNA-binding protein